jgi:hypothetical protein
LRLFPSRRIYSILDLEGTKRKAGPKRQLERNGKHMTKRKPTPFSATKAVKANARERVGQPKPARVVDDTPRTGRQTKHKPKLDEIIQQGE